MVSRVGTMTGRLQQGCGCVLRHAKGRWMIVADFAQQRRRPSGRRRFSYRKFYLWLVLPPLEPWAAELPGAVPWVPPIAVPPTGPDQPWTSPARMPPGTVRIGGSNTCAGWLARAVPAPACGGAKTLCLGPADGRTCSPVDDVIARPATKLPKSGGILPPGIDSGPVPALPTNTVRREPLSSGGVAANQPAGARVILGTRWKLFTHQRPR